MSKKIDWKKTETNVIQKLTKDLLPLQYSAIFGSVVEWSNTECYSDNTIPLEKFRQHYSDHYNNSVGFYEGGKLYLKEWFPDKDNLNFNFFEPDPYTIEIDYVQTFNAGYEFARREQYLFKWNKNESDKERFNRVVNSFTIQENVKYFFKSKFENNYLAPTNEKCFEKPSKDDFRLVINNRIFIVDIKSFSYTQNGYDMAVARNIEKDIIYICAKINSLKKLEISGVISGDLFLAFGKDKNNKLIHLQQNYLFPISILFVMINMSNQQMDYFEFLNNIKNI